MDISETFLATADVAAELLGGPEVAAAWDSPSALEGYTVAGLSGHLARAVLVVESYLDAAPDASLHDVPTDVVDASGYFAAVLADHDPVDSDVHRAVRARGVDVASPGPAALAEEVRAAARRLEVALDVATLRRPIEVYAGIRVTVEQYLLTRLLELVVHTDDLAVSVGREPEVSEDACRLVASLLGEVAARRVGGLNAVRALARRERHPAPLRAL